MSEREEFEDMLLIAGVEELNEDNIKDLSHEDRTFLLRCLGWINMRAIGFKS